MIRTKRIYEPGEIQDGNRVLVMRLWPRGIRKEAVDLWLRDLGADPANIKAWKAGRLEWPEMRRRYLAGLRRPEARAAFARLRALARLGTVTLLCSCEDEMRCHRGLLKQVLNRAPRSTRKRATSTDP
ncbi:MAG: DUF488 family protein [Candidatus Rokubacteria bacterium]|nr:DUF488 family protein [Candidatus Rokubacteria bacterium]